MSSCGNEAWDFEATPKPLAKRRVHKRAATYDTVDGSGVSSPGSSASSISTKRSRLSASPSKQQSWLAALAEPIDKVGFRELEHVALPDHIARLRADIIQYSRGQQTIPETLKQELVAQDPSLSSVGHLWRSTLVSPGPSQETEQSYDEPLRRSAGADSQPVDRITTFREADMIVQEATRCQQRNDHEAGWNSHVHGPLLMHACYLSQHSKRVYSVNLTQARLLEHLRPGSSEPGTLSLPGKMIDFGICLESNPCLRRAYKQLSPEANGISRYLNQTDSDLIARNPLVISIETKRAEHGGAEADMQLGIWVGAHFRRLAIIRRRPLPDRTVWLPMLKVVGPVWNVIFASGEYDDEGRLLGTTVYSSHLLGDVTTYLGFFQVLAALQSLIRWAEEDYRPWFEAWMTA